MALRIEFIPPDARRRDDDNCLSCFKAGRDGIAEALGVDDSRFVTTFWLSDKPVKGGMVRVSIGEIGA
jgi:crossover junction endodeoxyribonuclease RusA